MTMARNYRAEYDNYQGTPEQRKNRAARNRARYKLEKEGVVEKGDGKDVAHVQAISKGGGNGRSNLTVQPKSVNRSFARTKTGALKSERSKRER